MNRTLEPELMDDLEQARAYAEADFEEPNRLFVEEFTARFADWSGTGTILDLGCGPGDIVLRMAHAYPGCRVDGLDGSAAMLSFAEAALAGSGLENRVRFVQGLVPGADLPESHYDAITSNSLLHHLHRPEVLWKAVRALGAPGAPVLVMDLMRPDTPEQAREIVETYAAEEAPVLKTDFFNSLLAAFEVGELRAQLDAAGLTTLGVEPVSDRHLIVAGRMPAR
jgi:cyclopropane fatty-acyl-phospholipid synthase-like methyltransferase